MLRSSNLTYFWTHWHMCVHKVLQTKTKKDKWRHEAPPLVFFGFWQKR